ncbi:MAG: RNB domain-containing ribonuclease [Gallionella sp.]|nr:RNB domain-containing ribonuclease [Gallionella sp.]MDD4945665.1 RNB domain-containing ribonuclease [Gallionella sp.]MDD5611645.1 RNB domain-containing ribonuclease [Gallionella sp.]
MNILYEENGSFKVGSVMTDNTTSLQIESLSGKRSKIKAASVMLHFSQPEMADFLPQAEMLANDIEVEFLWECCPPDEFGFEDIAAEYFGHQPNSLEAAATLIRLHHAPVYFHKKGKGRYRAAPPEILKAALAGAEKKRLAQELQARFTAQLCNFELPEEFAPQLKQLLYAPERNTLEYKALEDACTASHLSAPHLLQRCGAISSTHDYHLQKFLFENFPSGTDFPPIALSDWDELPMGAANAFSIDDASTTEIDDAFSVERQENGHWRIGVHIAAPALGMPRDSDGDKVALARLSTVYMPGNKITMLPDAAVQAFTLTADRVCPALSMYIEVEPETLAILSYQSRIERVHIAANLRHETLEPLFNEETLTAGKRDYPYAEELLLLWQLVQKLEAGRGKPSDNGNRLDYNFHIENDHVTITNRRRGSPIDKVVSELMILVNCEWGGHLAEHGFPGIYRTQQGGKVRMSTVAAPHQGLGVAQYMWSSSPLRRYVDLLNQRQIIAMLRNEDAPYPKNDTALYAAMRSFDTMYGIYSDFQRNMERYWCLRWLQQQQSQIEGELVIIATVLRENLVVLDDIPLVFRASSLPEQLPPRTRVQLAVTGMDLLDLSLQTRHVATLEAAPAATDAAETDSPATDETSTEDAC